MYPRTPFHSPDDAASSVDAAPASDAAAGSAAAAEAAPAPDPAPSAQADSSYPEWNGELERLEQQPWWQELPEPVRPKALAGIRAKYQNWEKGYRPKMEANAAEAKRLETVAAQIQEDEARLTRWLSDPDSVTGEISQLQAAHAQETQKLQGELKALQEKQAALEAAGKTKQADKAQDDVGQKLAQIQQEYDQFKAEATAFRSEVEAARQAEIATASEELFDWLTSEAPDVVNNTAAYDLYVKLIAANVEPEDALTATRAKFPSPAKVEPEQPSPAMTAMNNGGRSGTKPSSMGDYFKLIAEKERAFTVK